MPFVGGKNDKIVCIADIVFRFQLMLHKLVKIIHVYIHEQLARQVTEWQSFGYKLDIRCPICETADDFGNENANVFVGNISAHDAEQYRLINGREELLDVAFQDPAGASVIARYFVCKLPESIHRAMCSLSIPA